MCHLSFDDWADAAGNEAEAKARAAACRASGYLARAHRRQYEIGGLPFEVWVVVARWPVGKLEPRKFDGAWTSDQEAA